VQRRSGRGHERQHLIGSHCLGALAWGAPAVAAGVSFGRRPLTPF
jgi:hypothetical protein